MEVTHAEQTAAAAVMPPAERAADEAERARLKAEQEAEAARLAAERAELERQRAEAIAAAQAAQAKAKAEADRMAQERAALEAARAEFEQRAREHEQRERDEQAAREAAAALVAEPAKPILIDEDGDVPLIADTSATPEFFDDGQPVQAPTPSAAQLIQAVAEMFGVGLGEARDWLVERAADIEATRI